MFWVTTVSRPLSRIRKKPAMMAMLHEKAAMMGEKFTCRPCCSTLTEEQSLVQIRVTPKMP